MLCTGKSGSSNNWLDKLRSSKGFPDGNGHDLEHFLNPNPDSDYDVNLEKNDPKSNSDLVVLEEKGVSFRSVTNSKPHQQQSSSSTMEKEDLFDIMSSVLAELFNMGGGGGGGDSDRIRGGFDKKKKSSRKQSNPRICVTSGSASVDDCCLNEARKSEMSPSSADNSVAEEKKKNRLKMMKKQGNIVVPVSVEDEKMKVDYSGYSRADVMVIDTSATVWKSEKIVFRKGSVWKVRDKKSKCRRVFGSRKRKNNQSDDSEGGGNKKKKKKRKKKKQKLSLIPSSTIKEVADHEKCIVLSNEPCPLDIAVGGTFNPNHVLELRHRFSRSARKPAKSGSSVFHVQDVPMNKKNDVLLLKNCP